MGCFFSRPNDQENKVYYHISIKTSAAYKKAGTNATVYVELVGNSCQETGYLRLCCFCDAADICEKNFKVGKVDYFKILAKDVGLPVLVRLKLEGSCCQDNKWHCDDVNVSVGNDPTKVTFPVYNWIENNVEVARGDGILPQNAEPACVQSARNLEIETNKKLFAWVKPPSAHDEGWGLPRYVNAKSYNDLPRLFKRNSIRSFNLNKEGAVYVVESIVNSLKVFHKPLHNLSSFRNLYEHPRVHNGKQIDEDWCLDETMGRQVLTGISPLMTARCDEIPDYFSVTNDDVKSFLRDGKTLQEEMEAGKVYISDYVKLIRKDLVNKGFYCPSCVGLFYVNEDGNFVPIAIQLVKEKRDYLFTPNDAKDDWLLAKMYFRCASTNIHQWIFHFLHTHNIMEPFAVALFRCFPRSHPVYKLMRPHLQTVSAINADARTLLIPDNGAGDQALSLSALKTSRKFYEDFTFEDMVIPKILKKQKIDDPELLPKFYYRDDALALWQAMENYVSNVINYYYKNDHDIEEDYELQDFARDVTEEGLNWQPEKKKVMPNEIKTKEQLIEICVTLMFTSSAQHAAVNFGQFNTYKFIPNSPACMRLPPHKKGEADMERIIHTLPGFQQSIIIIALSHTLSSFSPNEEFLGQFPLQFFTEEPILAIQQEYRNELTKITETINERNKYLIHKYEYLLPSRVPNSIAI